MAERPGYVLLLEQGIPQPALEELGSRVEQRLQELNCEYKEKRRTNRLTPLTVQTLNPGTWTAFRQQRVGPRGNFDALGKGEKAQLGIFWREERDIRMQLGRWNVPERRGSQRRKLDRLIPRLIDLHRSLLTNSQTAELLLAQDLAEITRFAARR